MEIAGKHSILPEDVPAPNGSLFMPNSSRLYENAPNFMDINVHAETKKE